MQNIGSSKGAIMNRETIAVVIATKNEEDQIRRCLESIKWVDEIVVIDDLSDDRTVEIAQEYGAKVISHKSKGYLNQQWNIGVSIATSTWILEMDADEVVTEELKVAIQKILSTKSNYAGYEFRRKNHFLGHFMKFGGCYDCYYTKLFKRKLGKHIGYSIHSCATLQVDGKIGTIDADIEHYPFKSIAQFVQRQNFYTSVEVKIMYENSKIVDERTMRYQMLRRPFKLFWKLYIKKKGYRDGKYGLIFVILNTWKHFLFWAKYWELSRANETYANCEKVACCDLCGSDQEKLVDRPGNIVQCLKCGLRFVNPRLLQKDITQDYDRNYKHYSVWNKINPQAELMYQSRFDFLDKFIKNGKILDVGAGRGEFLAKAKRKGTWECFGTETSKTVARFAKEKFGIAFSLGQLEEIKYPDKSFDVICLWHVLEHLPYPSRAIKEAERILKDNGFLFIAVPNDSWFGRRHFFKNALKKTISHLPIKNKLKLKKMYPKFNEEPTKHLFYFTPSTLKKLLGKYGFKIREHSVDYDYESTEPKIRKKYGFELLCCRFTKLNFGNAILIAAQKGIML